ncbi:hypothetical protein [Ureibacillus sp. FSL W7-1570]|uniref:hypothetical protein n=1 Tax=Ureibacillus sp. FSL W7-1570 TaxID=2954593 RepID=UPI003159F0F2
MEKLINEIKNSYYEYVVKIAPGCEIIANKLRIGEIEDALYNIIQFSEGLSWLLAVEEKLKEQHFMINSRISEAQELLKEINEALEHKDFITVADLFEYEIQPLFNSASEWTFEKF